MGTDVSAKYKGAFCEAKIKKVVRNIKCKVRDFFMTSCIKSRFAGAETRRQGDGA